MQFFAPTTPVNSAMTPGDTGTNSPRIRMPPSIQQLIRRQGEELFEPRLEYQVVDQFGRLAQLAGGRPAELGCLLLAKLRIVLPAHLSTIVQARAALDPQPELGPGDRAGRCLLHQVEDPHRARSL